MSILGLETEYGVFVTGLGPEQRQPDPISLSEAVIGAVDAPGTRWDYADEQPLTDARGTVLPRRIAHPDLLTDEVRQANRLLGNGGRSYVDHAHPEWSGPEVTSATDAVIWDRAGDRLHAAAARRASQLTGLEIHLVKNTTDNKGRSYGCHENYLLPRELPFERIVQQFTGFLVSRVVVTGAGRVGLGQAGEQPGFQLSQRADFFERLVGLETTVKRPIINTRDEPHADQRAHRRLHVITGDANLCQVATLVKVGSAQLALRAIVAGAELPQLADPLTALRAFSRDPSCTVTQPCIDGVARTAVELQRLWLEAATGQVGQRDTITDAELVLRHWDAILADLAIDPARCADRLDWAAKLRLLNGLRARHGCGWDDPRLTALDLRYADLTEGLFIGLEAAGAVRTLVEEEDVTRAESEPPSESRAWLRGTLVSRFAEHIVAANWDRISFATPVGVRTLHLTSPLAGIRQHYAAVLDSVHEMHQLLSWGESIGWSPQSGHRSERQAT
ncbi:MULTISPECIES: depupylase/deamidase Dop [unclassified Luteococcus]|uniref:depupylase/deamidase Dop n=1 Tax=unclassified Luteococcus TaxID=2639923 RepID=UPI00313DAF00